MPIVQQSPSSAIVAGSLARLAPFNLMPERYSRHMQIVTKLKQIRRVQVSNSSSDKNGYVIDVFTLSQSITHIPTSLKAADAALAAAKGRQSVPLFRQPDVHVEKHFADFVELRDQLYETCRSAHPNMNCKFCSEVARFLLLGAVLPGTLLTWLLPQNQRTKAVQRFVESLLQLAASCPVIDADACPCQEKLPRQLTNFLFGDANPLA